MKKSTSEKIQIIELPDKGIKNCIVIFYTKLTHIKAINVNQTKFVEAKSTTVQ